MYVVQHEPSRKRMPQRNTIFTFEDTDRSDVMLSSSPGPGNQLLLYVATTLLSIEHALSLLPYVVLNCLDKRLIILEGQKRFLSQKL